MNEHPPIFIYGTLRPGQKNYGRFLAGRTSEEIPATTSGELYLFLDPGGARYPFLIPGNETVHGDLVYLKNRFHAETLEDLDHLEGYDPRTDKGLYLRRLRQVVTESGERISAWTYLWNGPWTEVVKIRDGDFAKTC